MDPGAENATPFWSFPLIATVLLSAEMLTGTTADSLPGRVLIGPLKVPFVNVPLATAVLLKAAGAFFAISTKAPLGVPEPESDFTFTLNEIGCPCWTVADPVVDRAVLVPRKVTDPQALARFARSTDPRPVAES